MSSTLNSIQAMECGTFSANKDGSSLKVFDTIIRSSTTEIWIEVGCEIILHTLIVCSLESLPEDVHPHVISGKI